MLKRTLEQTGAPPKRNKASKGLLTHHIKTAESALTSQAFQNRALVDACIAEVENKLQRKPPVFVFGKWRQQPRNVGFFSDESVGYKYSRQLMKSQPLSKGLKALLEEINALYTGADFNGILVNEYEHGDDTIGAHSDDEKGLSGIGVVSLSIGAIRKFRIRHKVTKKIVIDVPTVPYTLIHMTGAFQREFTHEIPKERRIKDRRLSLTFRKHIE
jgi:alkylated DNA repair dioxygenase AlkB